MFGSRHYYDDDRLGFGRRPRFGRAVSRRSVALLSTLVNFVFGAIYAIVGLRIVLEVLGARDANRFKQLVNDLSAPLLGAFQGLLPSLTVARHQLPISFLFALAIYALIHFGLRRLIWAVARSR